MIGAGTIINPIVKIVTTVAILAAISIFVVKPILDTTEKFSDEAGRHAAQISKGIRDSQRSNDLSTARSSALSTASSVRLGSQPWNAAAREISGCVRQAKESVSAMRACGRMADGIQDAQFDRNFALPYADSLDAQGKGADAEKVRSCVSKAGFKVGPMSACRKLADRLLFG